MPIEKLTWGLIDQFITILWEFCLWKKLTWGLTYFDQFIFPVSFPRERRVVAGLRVRRESLCPMSRLPRSQQLGKIWSLTGFDKQFFSV